MKFWISHLFCANVRHFLQLYLELWPTTSKIKLLPIQYYVYLTIFHLFCLYITTWLCVRTLQWGQWCLLHSISLQDFELDITVRTVIIDAYSDDILPIITGLCVRTLQWGQRCLLWWNPGIFRLTTSMCSTSRNENPYVQTNTYNVHFNMSKK